MVDIRVLIGYNASVRPIEINKQEANEMKLSERTERTLIPESDIDKAVLLKIIEMSVDQMGKWKRSSDPSKEMYFSIDVDAEIDDNGELAARLISAPIEFDPRTIITDSTSEDAKLTVELTDDNRAVAVWHCGNESNLVATNCWVVR